jgi:hypothetical protein
MDISEYIKLIESYISGRISPTEFEYKYLKLFKEEKRIPTPAIYEVLNKLFTDVDAFTSDPTLRNQSSIDEKELLRCANQAYQQLKNIGS